MTKTVLFAGGGSIGHIAPAVAGAQPPAVQRWIGFQRLLHDPLGVLGLVLVGIIVFAAVLADWLAPYEPNALVLPALLPTCP